MNVELMRFENLREFMKPLTSHYILKHDISKTQSIYYSFIDSANFVIFAFCIDKLFKDYIKIDGSKICESTEQGGTTIVVANIIEDSLLKKIIKEFKLMQND
jgi:hypothetical protein